MACSHKPSISSVTHVTKEQEEQDGQTSGTKITIQKISHKGNFFRINRGGQDGIKLGDEFTVFGPRDQFMTDAEVVAVRPTSAFLRVKELSFEQASLRPGLEVRPKQKP